MLISLLAGVSAALAIAISAGDPSMTFTPLIVLLGSTAIMVLLGGIGFRRRDVDMARIRPTGINQLRAIVLIHTSNGSTCPDPIGTQSAI